MIVQESYQPRRMTASGVIFTGPGQLGGFFATAAGTVQITDADATSIVDAFTVTAGVFYPLPFSMGNGASCVLAAGAQGTFAYKDN
jgi:hypothetical protein